MATGKIKKEDIEKVMQTLKARKVNAPIEISTGFECLDLMLGGFHKGEMTVIAAHRGIGKTCFVIGIVEHLCLRNNISVAYFTMQASREQLLEKMLFSFIKIHPFKARYGNIDNNEWEIIANAGKMFLEKSLYIDDTSRLTPVELKDRVLEINKEEGRKVQCVIVDYLQMMDTEVYRPIQRQRTAEISEGLKSLACEFGLPVIVLSELYLEYETEFKKSRRPGMNDMKEDLIVDRYADVVMLLHRDNYYYRGDPDFEPNNNAEVIITRNRTGPTGVVSLRFNEDSLRFEKILFDNY